MGFRSGEYGGRKITKTSIILSTVCGCIVHDDNAVLVASIKRHLQQSTGTDVSEPTVCRFLQKAGFTGTKIQHVASQQSEEFRAYFATEM